MNTDWQTWAALVVVATTVSVMIWRIGFKKKTGCGSGCGCGSEKLKPRSQPKPESR